MFESLRPHQIRADNPALTRPAGARMDDVVVWDWCSAMKQLVATVIAAVLAGVVAPIAAAQPDNQDQVFFDNLAREGLHPEYDKQICGSIKCEPLRDLLVQEGHVVCDVLESGQAPLVPFSVIANLNISPSEAEAFIAASRQAYCPDSPDPYSAPLHK